MIIFKGFIIQEKEIISENEVNIPFLQGKSLKMKISSLTLCGIVGFQHFNSLPCHDLILMLNGKFMEHSLNGVGLH